MSELKNCPFCGNGKLEIAKAGDMYQRLEGVQCNTDGCPIFGIWCRVDEWNTRTPDPSTHNGNWPEDSTHENGNYSCKCSTCGNEFVGHKRRVTCKLCAINQSTQKVVDAAKKSNGKLNLC